MSSSRHPPPGSIAETVAKRRAAMAAATPEQRFKEQWLAARVPLESASKYEKVSWRTVNEDADGCEELVWTANNTVEAVKDTDIELSVSLHRAWQEEQQRQLYSQREREWANHEAQVKYEQREEQLAQDRARSQAQSAKLAQSGLVLLHEKHHCLDAVEGGSHISLDVDEDALEDDFDSEEAKEAGFDLDEAKEAATQRKLYIVPTATARQLHKLRNAPPLSIREVERSREHSREPSPAKADTDPVIEHRAATGGAGKRRGPSSVASQSSLASAKVREANSLQGSGMAALLKQRAGFTTAASFTAFAAAAQEEARREKGFEGTALGPPRRQWWRPFLDTTKFK